MSQNAAPSSEQQAEPVLTTCQNCHSHMPSQLRFCRNCGYRLGEGLAEYTETVRFADAQQAPFHAPQQGSGQMATTYGLGAVEGQKEAGKKGRKKMSGMTWLFLGLLCFFVIAAALTAIIAPTRNASRGIVAAVTAPRSMVGVNDFDTVESGGVTFDRVEAPDTPADKAGLVGGDVITSFDGQTVTSSGQMRDLVRQTPIGKTVDIVYIRDGETKTTKLTTVSNEEFERLQRAFEKRPEGRGRFGIRSGRTERVQITGTNMFGVQLEEGAIDPSLPADMAGVKDGDIIVEFGETPIRTPEEFTMRIRRAIPYSTVIVKLMRGGQPLEIPVKIGR